MPERDLRRRIPATGRKSRPPNPTPSNHRKKPTPRLSRPLNPIKIPQRCSSEPDLCPVRILPINGEHHTSKPDTVALLRPHTCTDDFASPLKSPSSPFQLESESMKNHDDAKVVVKVTVEGSSGPVRAMVRLSLSLEEMIRLVVKKYSEEGRSPKLDKKAASSFELHDSYFSLQSLNKTDTIRDVGSRNFYLRKSVSTDQSKSEDEGNQRVSSFYCSRFSSSSSASENVPCKSSDRHSLQSLVAFIVAKLGMIGRRMSQLWRRLCCI